MSPAWVIATAGILIAVFIVTYRKVMRPLRTIANGVELLRAQDFSSRLAHVGQKEADRIVDMFNGMMSALKEERLKLREQNHFLDLLIGVSPMGIIIVGQDGRISDCNQAAASFMGVKSPKDVTGINPGTIHSRLSDALFGLKDREVKEVRLNNSKIYRCSRLSFMERGISHPFYLIEHLTEEVRRAEKKSYEKVIRMMAHEVNNSLAGIISTTETVADMTTDATVSEALAACRDRGRDLSDFITKFASAVKIPQPTRRDTDLCALINNLIPLFESICASCGSTLKANLPSCEVHLSIDPVLMEQALTNIVKNAAESAGEAGEVEISLDPSSHSLEVSDNGPGISEEASAMLFTPFFTTKENGHGLGLLLVNEVLNSHNLRFSLSTHPDSITRFTIDLHQ